MKKLMILGASYSQMPLYKTAAKLGISTLAVSTPGNWPGFQAADEYCYTDISDFEAVLKAAQEYKIDGVTTCCLDAGVRSMGYVCEHMGLKGLSANAGKLCNDKYLMKEAFVKGGVNCAQYRCIHKEEDLEDAMEVLSFPLIIKAVDLMGSRGIFRCNTKEEVFLYYKKTMEATRKEYCILEEFIEGEMLGCEAMICDGELLFCLPDNTENYPGYVPTPIGHSVPYRKQKELGKEVEKQVKLAIRALGLDNCPVNCDLMEKDGKIYVIEITGRVGGTCLPETVGLYYGIDYYEAIIRLAMGMDVKEMFAHKEKHVPNLTHILASDTGGILKEIHNENKKEPFLKDLSFNVSPGEKINRYENGRDRLGQVILTGETLEKCEEHLQDVLEKINIEFIS